MKNQKIQFKESDSGIPIIELGEYGRLVFSRITSHPHKGYKYLCYSNNYMDAIVVKKNGDGNKVINVPTNDSYVINMMLERNARLGKGLPYGTIPQRLKDYLKKKLLKYLDDEYFPYYCVEELKEELEGKEIESILGKVQKKRKPRKIKKLK